MFGARFRIFATCSNVATGRLTNSIVNRVRCARVFVTPAYSTRSRQLNLAHSEALRVGVLGKRAPFLLPARASVVGRRLYATDENKPSSTQEGSKSQSILTRLLEEEQQPKALTVGERGVYCYGYRTVKLSLF